jgi:hypothetical protein
MESGSALKTFIIVGVATLTMLVSSMDMNAPMRATRTGASQWYPD